MPPSPYLIESKYAVYAAVAGFLIMLVLSHGSLFAAISVLAAIGGLGWVVQRVFRHHNNRTD